MIAIVVYLAMVLWSLPIISGDAGGLMPFDLRPGGYSYDEAQEFLSALGPQGRTHYLGPQHWLDLFYPGLMALSLVLAYLILFARKWAVLFSAVAVLAAVFDWAENSAVAEMLNAGVDGVSESLVGWASVLTILKSGAVTLAMLLLLLGCGRVLVRRYQERSVKGN
ncbi:hypothetical protein O2N63_15630 [Aliiroseovarius sp. KMU-50]|uniref:ABC transporter permease n=1 Tax=Aliiroseovarius salicola TaxID=3009082 RepID=A0ABT4W4R8_9RHOB|nr:hypothetical protein [Aliiroseovarius sp. KMU-50]MDA5095520.1 hypothetical protein [Aliiroseovarius sp. KMU-50]